MKYITPIENSSASKQEQITKMFDDVSKNYDKINRIITLGQDRKWRKKIINYLSKDDDSIFLDLATGTGDMIPLLSSLPNATKIIGVDISAGMLEIARSKYLYTSEKDLQFLLVDSEVIPLEDESIDVVTIAYGIRNFENHENNLKEIYRVLKPQGKLIILETSVPNIFLMKNFYYFYTKVVMPFIGNVFSRSKYAYKYLAASAEKFPYGKSLGRILNKNGFNETKIESLFFGVSMIYYFKKE